MADVGTRASAQDPEKQKDKAAPGKHSGPGTAGTRPQASSGVVRSRKLPSPEVMQKLWEEINPTPLRPYPGFGPWEWPVHALLENRSLENSVLIANECFVHHRDQVEIRLVDRGEGSHSVLLVFFDKGLGGRPRRGPVGPTTMLRQVIVRHVRDLTRFMADWCRICAERADEGKEPWPLHKSFHRSTRDALLKSEVPTRAERAIGMVAPNRPFRYQAPKVIQDRVRGWAESIIRDKGSLVWRFQSLRDRAIEEAGEDENNGYLLRVALELWEDSLGEGHEDVEPLRHLQVLQETDMLKGDVAAKLAAFRADVAAVERERVLVWAEPVIRRATSLRHRAGLLVDHALVMGKDDEREERWLRIALQLWEELVGGDHPDLKVPRHLLSLQDKGEKLYEMDGTWCLESACAEEEVYKPVAADGGAEMTDGEEGEGSDGEDDVVEVNREGIIAEIARIGGDLIERIEVKGQ
ncbi:hypothetical protein CONLIGDRAFT_677943 [Coniochaeta ligniaria NRRL 30616]|uniref:Uncharacterized protein n=1 Tax=Coniochaeta ligniaria NRRL 30616 TaxID=1408157 RepID=A0A1J7IVZ3_9PEZI|nr:hypothetical protein CONLIGDRAFT_677943 [Coniochaeta ligniaria NRRL 30616]